MQARYRWRTVSGRGLEHLTLEQRAGGGWHARSVAIADDGFACTYDVVIDAAWRTRHVRAVLEGTKAARDLTHDGAGNWTVDGHPAPLLSAAIDTDLAVSAFTNTLAIRRLGLAIGQSADIVTGYVSFPDMAVFPDPQRYTRVAERTYLYESRDSDFRGEIEVDADGVMLRFDRMFVRED